MDRSVLLDVLSLGVEEDAVYVAAVMLGYRGG